MARRVEERRVHLDDLAPRLVEQPAWWGVGLGVEPPAWWGVGLGIGIGLGLGLG